MRPSISTYLIGILSILSHVVQMLPMDKENVDPLQLSTFKGYQYDYNLAPLGVYKFYYSLPKSSRYEERTASGEVKGGYAYVAPEGDEFKFKYEAGKAGFLLESNALPTAPEDTDEVKKAKEQFFNAYEKALELTEADGYGKKLQQIHTQDNTRYEEEKDDEEDDESDEDESDEDSDEDDDESSEEDDESSEESSEEDDESSEESSEEDSDEDDDDDDDDDDDEEEEEEEEETKELNLRRRRPVKPLQPPTYYKQSSSGRRGSRYKKLPRVVQEKKFSSVEIPKYIYTKKPTVRRGYNDRRRRGRTSRRRVVKRKIRPLN